MSLMLAGSVRLLYYIQVYVVSAVDLSSYSPYSAAASMSEMHLGHEISTPIVSFITFEVLVSFMVKTWSFQCNREWNLCMWWTLKINGWVQRRFLYGNVFLYILFNLYFLLFMIW